MIVAQSPLDRLPDELATTARARRAVDLLDQAIGQLYVQSHVQRLAHRPQKGVEVRPGHYLPLLRIELEASTPGSESRYSQKPGRSLPRRDPHLFLQDILESITRIRSYTIGAQDGEGTRVKAYVAALRRDAVAGRSIAYLQLIPGTTEYDAMAESAAEDMQYTTLTDLEERDIAAG